MSEGPHFEQPSTVSKPPRRIGLLTFLMLVLLTVAVMVLGLDDGLVRQERRDLVEANDKLQKADADLKKADEELKTASSKLAISASALAPERWDGHPAGQAFSGNPMKLDFLTPEQWKNVLSLTQATHSDLERRMGRGFLRCGNCGERQPLTARLVKQYLEQEGFPIHCPGTLKGGTMNFYATESNLERELALEGASSGS